MRVLHGLTMRSTFMDQSQRLHFSHLLFLTIYYNGIHIYNEYYTMFLSNQSIDLLTNPMIFYDNQCFDLVFKEIEGKL